MIRMWNKSGLTQSGDVIPPPKPDRSKRSRPWQVTKAPTPFRLSAEDMEYLTRHTHYDASEIKSWHKGFSKDCPDGNLQREQVLEVCTKILPAFNAEPFVAQIFRIFDKDGNGSIDFKEFMLATDMAKSGDPEEKLRWAFKLYDMDNSGSIEVSEMTEAIATLYAMEGMEAPYYRKARRLFRLLDTDGDGEVTVDEFVEGCMKDEELIRMLSADADDNIAIAAMKGSD